MEWGVRRETWVGLANDEIRWVTSVGSGLGLRGNTSGWLPTCFAQVNSEESRLAAALVSLSLWPESSLNALSIARNNRSTSDTRSPLLSVSW